MKEIILIRETLYLFEEFVKSQDNVIYVGMSKIGRLMYTGKY